MRMLILGLVTGLFLALSNAGCYSKPAQLFSGWEPKSVKVGETKTIKPHEYRVVQVKDKNGNVTAEVVLLDDAKIEK